MTNKLKNLLNIDSSRKHYLSSGKWLFGFFSLNKPYKDFFFHFIICYVRIHLFVKMSCKNTFLLVTFICGFQIVFLGNLTYWYASCLLSLNKVFVWLVTQLISNCELDQLIHQWVTPLPFNLESSLLGYTTVQPSSWLF